jgi:hypothetical protein
VSKKTKTTKLVIPGGWRLLVESLGDFRLHLWRYLALVAIVAVPSNLISMSSTFSADTTVIVYENIGSLFMTAALLWAVTRAQGDDSLKLRRAYYEGSTMVLRFILIVSVLAIMALPAALGLGLYSSGTSATSVAVSPAVQLLLAGLAIVLALPTFYWLIRYGLSIYRVAIGDEWPIAALRSARRLTLGHFWPLAGRVAQLLLWLILVMLVPAFLFVGLAAATHAYIFIVLFQLSFSLLAVPLATLYVYRLYRAVAGE